LTELGGLRRFTLASLLVAFGFGVGTLWIRALWPFAVFQALIVMTACVWFAVAAWKHISMSAWLLLPACVAGIGVVQIWSGNTENAWQTRQSVLEWATHGCSAVLAYQVCLDSRLRRIALRTFAITAGSLALVSTLQNYSAPGRAFWLFETGYSAGVFGPFLYHTKLANFAELALPVALWLAVHERRNRQVYAAAAVALLGSVVAAGSRGGIVILAAEVAVVGVAAWHCLPAFRKTRKAVLAASAAAYGIVICGCRVALDRFASHDALADLRLPVIATSIEMAGRYWMWGSGLGTWSSVYPEFARFDLHIRVNQAHCDWLQFLTEGGFLMPVCMAAMLFAAVRAARREWWTIGIAFVWAHGFIDYPMQQTPAFASLQVAFWGSASALLHPRSQCPSRKPLCECTGDRELAEGSAA
jgi:hypothetical protein